MTAKKLHEILTTVLALSGDVEVMVNTATFPESENGTLFEIESAKVQGVQGVDDSSPVGRKFTVVVITGEVHWHQHGEPIAG